MRKVEEIDSGGKVTGYKVRFRHGKSPKTGKPLQTSESFPATATGKSEAAQFAKELDALGVQEALDRLYDKAQQALVPNVNEIAAEHIALRPNTTDGTRLNYERLWERTWGRQIGHLAANRLTEDDLARAAMTLGRTYSRKSLENQRGLLSGVVGRAVRQGYLPENIARGMSLPAGVHSDRAEMRIITVEEFASIIDKVPAHYQTFVRTLYATGLRWGEAVALQAQDVALPNLRVRRALKWSPDNNRVVGETKTVRGNRTVAVTDELHDELRALTKGRKGSDLVFTAPRGGPILHRTFWSRVWLPAVGGTRCPAHKTEKQPVENCSNCWAGLDPRPRIHDLRHSHASVLLARGIPIHVVSRRLGHSNISVTVDTYGHLLPDAQMLAAQASSFAFITAEIEA